MIQKWRPGDVGVGRSCSKQYEPKHKCTSPLPKLMDVKRDIVDTELHASCTFGHNPMLGLTFPILWKCMTGVICIDISKYVLLL